MTWICNFKNYDLPILADTEEEAREILQKWLDEIEGDGEISDTLVETYSFNSGTRDITKIYLTSGFYDQDDPMGVAYLYDYGEFIKTLPSPDIDDCEEEDSEDPEVDSIEVTKKKCFSPLFGEDQTYSSIFHTLRIRDIGGNISICVLKEPANKDTLITTQNHAINWLIDNIPEEEVKFNYSGNKDQDALAMAVMINMKSNKIAIGTRRGTANSIVVGDDVAADILPSLSPEPTHSTIVYESPSYEIIGYINSMPVYRSLIEGLVHSDMAIMGYSAGGIDKGVFLLNDNGRYYLNKVEKDLTYPVDYKDYYRIIRFK